MSECPCVRAGKAPSRCAYFTAPGPGCLYPILPNTAPRPLGLLECSTVLDVGAGIRPMAWYTPSFHTCVEPYEPYGDVLRAVGFAVVGLEAHEALRRCGEYEAIYLLDVIEHMDREVGEEVLRLAAEKATRQVVVLTPDGFQPQSKDAWGMGGEHWQTHRSGWAARDFPAPFVCQHLHIGHHALYAVLTK